MSMEDLITEKERKEIVAAVIRSKSKVISIAGLAKLAKHNPNRARYTIELLIKEGTIRKVPVKDFGRHYKRYYYEVVSK